MRLIDGIADDISHAYQDGFNDARAMPTIDAVQVVRCRECAVPHNRWTGCPNLGGLVTPPDFYCAFGERKDGDAK